MAGGMHPRRGPGVPLGDRPVEGRDGRHEPVRTGAAFRRMMGMPDPAPAPVEVPGHVWVVADVTAGDAVTDDFAGLAIERWGALVRVVYADDDESMFDQWLAPEQLAPAPGERPAVRRSV